MKKLIVDTCVFINAFKEDSEYRAESTKFLNEMQARGQLITMPAHGLFEVVCTFKRITEHDKKFIPLNLTYQKGTGYFWLYIQNKYVFRRGHVPRVVGGLADGAVYQGMANDRYPVNIFASCPILNPFHLLIEAETPKLSPSS